jgi:hypothetical protein
MSNSKISALTSATTPLAGTEVLPIVQSSTTKQVSVANLTAGRAVSALTLALTSSGPVSQFNTGNTSSVRQQYINSGGTFQVGLDSSGGAIFGVPYAAVVWHGANYPVVFGVNNAEVARFDTSGNLVPATAAKGINFTANTPAAGMTSQLLNWYEEGTFTPTIIGTTTAGVGTYSVQTATYTRTGRVIRFNIAITWSAHTGTGNMEIAGLPFTASASANNHPVSILSSNLLVPLASTPVAMVLASATTVRLYTTPTTGTDASVSLLALDTAATLWVGGTYIV